MIRRTRDLTIVMGVSISSTSRWKKNRLAIGRDGEAPTVNHEKVLGTGGLTCTILNDDTLFKEHQLIMSCGGT